VGKGWLKERCALESRTNFFSFKKSPKTGCALDSRIYGILLLLLCVANIATVNFKLHNTCCLFQKCVIDCLTVASQKFHEWIFDITARYWNKFLYKIQWQLFYVKFKVTTLVSKSNFQWWSCHLGAGRSLALVVIVVALSQPTTRTGAGHAAVTSPSRWKKYSSV
jgi:hypothetical protein